jgi:hypothetical protein
MQAQPFLPIHFPDPYNAEINKKKEAMGFPVSGNPI